VGPALEDLNFEGVVAGHKEKDLDTANKATIEPFISVSFP